MGPCSFNPGEGRAPLPGEVARMPGTGIPLLGGEAWGTLRELEGVRWAIHWATIVIQVGDRGMIDKDR